MTVANKTKNTSNPEDERRLNALIELLEKLSIRVKYARGYFHGGLVRYKDQLFLYLNRAAKARHKIEVIVNELKYIEIPTELLTPELQDILKQETESEKNRDALSTKKE